MSGADEDGVKYDENKDDWSLLDLGALRRLIRVLMHGARKYPDPANWRRVTDHRRRYLNAAFRHLAAWADGEKLDAESGLPHLDHAAACVHFLSARDDEP